MAGSMTEQEQKIYKGYMTLMKIVKDNPENEAIPSVLISEFHRDIESWDGSSDINFINKYLTHKDLRYIAAEPKIGKGFFPDMVDEFVRFMNNKDSQEILKNLFRLRKENLEIIESNNLNRYSKISNKLIGNSIFRHLEGSELNVKPRVLVNRYYALLFPEISTTIANVVDLKDTLYYLLDTGANVPNNVETLQWRVRYMIDEFLIKHDLYNGTSKWFRGAIAWYIYKGQEQE